MAYNEMTTDIPEHSDLHPDFYWDRRARGLGATASRPSTSCGEENLLNFDGDPYLTENILIHEFSHAIHQMGLSRVDPDFDNRLKSLYEASMEKGVMERDVCLNETRKSIGQKARSLGLIPIEKTIRNTTTLVNGIY